MDYNQRSGKLKTMGYYFPRALKFFVLKEERFTHIIFVLMLFTSFLGMSSGDNPVINLLFSAIISLISAVYLTANIKEFRGKDYTVMECMRQVHRKALVVICTSLLYNIALLFGLFFLIIPGIILGVMFIFSTCYVVDLNCGVTDSFRASKDLTKGRRMEIFSIVFVFILLQVLILLPISIIGAAAYQSGRYEAFYFVMLFGGALSNLMQARLAAMMYVDLEYGHREIKNNDDIEDNTEE